MHSTRWWDFTNWFDPAQYTDLLSEAETLNNQWVLLERRAASVLPKQERLALHAVVESYVQFWNKEIKTTGSGWFFVSDDRDKLAAFKRQYVSWYKKVAGADPQLAVHVAPPEVTIGPGATYESRGLLTRGIETIEDKFQGLIQSKYTLPALAVGTLFLGFIWITARSGAKSGARYEYVYRRR
jgi:hypothetical protein